MDTTTDDLSTEAQTAALRREIAERRVEISRDLEVIGDRVSPGRVADRTRERTRRRMTVMRRRLMGSPGTGGSTFARLPEVGGSTSGIGSLADSVGERLGGMDPAGAVAGKVEGSPLAMGVVAFGIGFVAGSVLPASRSEEELAHRLEPGVTQLAQQAAATAKEAGEHLAPVVKEEAAAVGEQAKEAVGNLRPGAAGPSGPSGQSGPR